MTFFLTLFFLGAVIFARLVWQDNTNIVTCMAFWLGALSFDAYCLSQIEKTVRSVAWRLISYSGAVMNTIVTVANGGYMPVYGYDGVHGSLSSVWIEAEKLSHVNFPYLTDRISFLGAIWSIGDIFIFGGMFIGLIWYFGERVHLWFTTTSQRKIVNRRQKFYLTKN